MELLEISLEGNEQSLLQIYQDVYAATPDRIPSAEELHWRYGGNPYPVRIWVGRDGEKIVGLRPIAIKDIKIGEAVYPALHMLNIMVHPAYQGKGLFRSLMEKAWGMHGQEGVIAFTFPNENSIKAYRRWKDWFQLADLPLFIRMVPPKNFGETKSLVRFFAGYGAAAARCLRGIKPKAHGLTIQRVDEIDDGIEALWQRNKRFFDFIIPRDKQYLTWRYVTRPDVQYMIYKAVADGATVGFLVARTRMMFDMHLGLIVDFFADNNDRTILAGMLKQAVADLIAQGVHAIGLQFIGPESLKEALWDNGLFAVPKKMLPREFLMYARSGLKKVEGIRLSDFQRMFLTWGDNDAV